MIDLNTGVKFLENSRIRRVVVRCQIHNHTLTLCWPQTTEEGGLATSTSTAQEAGGLSGDLAPLLHPPGCRGYSVVRPRADKL